MKRAIWLWTLIFLSAGMAGPALAAEPGTETQVVPQENANRVGQDSPARQELNATAADDQGNPQAAAPADQESAEDTTALEEPNPQPPAPGPDFLWVEPYQLPDGLWVPGFWRPRVMAGFAWVDGVWNDTANLYLPGYWRPLAARRCYAWVPGYWLAGRWFPGLWRPLVRPGFIWVGGHWTVDGDWIFGYWRPARPFPPGWAWVPGYFDLHGFWVHGFWRHSHRPGYFWAPGHFSRRNGWVGGSWREGRGFLGGGRHGHYR